MNSKSSSNVIDLCSEAERRQSTRQKIAPSRLLDEIPVSAHLRPVPAMSTMKKNNVGANKSSTAVITAANNAKSNKVAPPKNPKTNQMKGSLSEKVTERVCGLSILNFSSFLNLIDEYTILGMPPTNATSMKRGLVNEADGDLNVEYSAPYRPLPSWVPPKSIHSTSFDQQRLEEVRLKTDISKAKLEQEQELVEQAKLATAAYEREIRHGELMHLREINKQELIMQRTETTRMADLAYLKAQEDRM